MAPNRPRRGKNPSQIKETVVHMTIPSTIMHSLLQKLDLTFERDIGMLNGKNTNTIPPTETLVAVQKQLTQLKQLFESISDSDKEFIDKIRAIRENKAKETARLKQEAAEAERAKEEAAKAAAAAAAAAEAAEAKAKAAEEEAEVKDEKKEILDALPSSAPGSPQKLEQATPDKPEESAPAEGGEDAAKESVSAIEKSKDGASQASGNDSAAAMTDGTQDSQSNADDEQSQEASKPGEEQQKSTDTTDVSEESNSSKKRELEDEASQPSENTNEDLSQEDGGVPSTSASSDEPPAKKQKQDEVDIDQMENNPNVKNPKSEFVISQTLPRAARNLGLYSEEGLESTGEEYLKKKYSVASYPTTDLKELLPGDLPDMDLSCAKPANQIQFSTFLSYVDNFFKELSEDDIKLLKAKYILPANLEVDKTYDPNVTPFIIPKLGPLYTRTWFKADANKKVGNISPPNVSDTSSIIPKKGANAITDAILETEDISCGPLLSRLLSAIFRDEGNDLANTVANEENSMAAAGNQGNTNSIDVKMENNDESSNNLGIENHEQTPGPSAAETPSSNLEEIAKFSIGGTTSTLKMDQGWKINSVNLDYPTLEERLKRELKYVGIYTNLPKDENKTGGDDPDWLTGREDDEVSAELRELQNSLKQSTSRNQKRKEVLVTAIEKQLAWLEYSSILDDLDKQVDQAYIKRVRVPKKRKKHHTSGGVNTGTASQIAQQKAANSSLKALLDKRQRWITKIGPLFGPSELMKRIPKKSIFSDLDQDDDEDEGDEGDVFDHNDHEGKDGDEQSELET
ncbi:histone acetyltransferase [Maudiozyma humilis]|uniref:Histone acetyltransferase n=1 Tax=Maudiozyma humilis TaxID=51915 RepID=A0AAV5RWZ2_MAUHU|nr:histone acetyltransferase [Kazachstania humilis]